MNIDPDNFVDEPINPGTKLCICGETDESKFYKNRKLCKSCFNLNRNNRKRQRFEIDESNGTIQQELAMIRDGINRINHEFACFRTHSFDELQSAVKSCPSIDPLWKQLNDRNLQTYEDLTKELLCAKYYVELLKQKLGMLNNI